MLQVSLTGNLGTDPETRFTPDGEEIVSFRMAVNQKHRNEQGEDTPMTTWFRVKCSGWRAEAAKELVKGMRVLVIGRLELSTYVDRNGETRQAADVWADQLEAMRPPAPDGNSAEGARNLPRNLPTVALANAAAQANRHMEDDDEDDLPF